MRTVAMLLLSSAVTLSACGHEKAARQTTRLEKVEGTVVTLESRAVPGVFEASGVAEPMAEATLSTKLMASVREVRVREGDMVRAGQILALLDARDLIAKDAQAGASIGEAQAMQREAETQAQRMRTLYSEEAAPKAQLDAAETALARANAALAAARAGAAELSAVRDYSVIRAPFAGVVTRRFVDAGAFAAPGAPLLTVQDSRRLRVVVTAAPNAVSGLTRGDSVDVQIEGVTARAVIEGAVPAGGSVYRVNAIVDNPQHRFLPGSAASISLPLGTRAAMLIPTAALRREGDLTGVLVRRDKGDEIRWIRIARVQGNEVEVVAGLREGEQIVVPSAAAGVH